MRHALLKLADRIQNPLGGYGEPSIMLITGSDCPQLLCEGYEVFFCAQIRFQREQSSHVMYILRPSS